MRDVERLQDTEFDVVVVGGGTTGTSSAYHLASSGYKVLLIERNDFGTGSSSRSTRILHCGLLNLRTATSFWQQLAHPVRFARAVETTQVYKRARAELSQTMPARFNPFRCYLPVYDGDLFKPWQISLALKLVEGLSPRDVPINSRKLNKREALERPLLKWLRDPEKLRSVHGFDEFAHDWGERMALDNAIYARSLGAQILNYTELLKASRQGDSRWELDILDKLQDRKLTVSCKAVLNTAGIWVDSITKTTGVPVRPRIAATKGAHIVVKLPEECRGIGLVTNLSDGMPVALTPFRDSHHFGPTDVEYDGDPNDIHVTRAEADYLFEELHRLLPHAGLQRKQVISSWAGLRPWTNEYHANKKKTLHPRAHDHEDEGLPNFISITGVSITAQREGARLALKTVKDRITPSQPGKQIDYTKISTYTVPDAANAEVLKTSNILGELVNRSIEKECAATLEDILLRRLGFDYQFSKGADLADAVSRIAAGSLGWDETERELQVESFERAMQKTYQPREEKREG